MKRPLIDRLREVFSYDDKIVDTVEIKGIEYTLHGALIWNQDRGGAKANTIAGCVDKGSSQISLDRMTFSTSSAVYAFHNGVWVEQIDHINGDKLDNRIDNLRPATSLQNRWNVGLTRANKTGAVGVYQHKNGTWWWSCTTAKKEKTKHGYATMEAASEAREKHVLAVRGEFAYGFVPEAKPVVPAPLQITRSKSPKATGFPGVYKTPSGRFVVYKSLGGARHYLGTFDSFTTAKTECECFTKKWARK